VQRWPILENLAVSPRGLAKGTRRDAGGAVKGSHEIGKIAEAYVVGDVGDGAILVGQKQRRMTQPGTYQVLVRGDPEHIGEKA